MASSKETKARVSNFSSKEEAILLSIIAKNTDIIENKKTDSNINKRKTECWKKIELEFNNQSGEVFRDWSTLRKKYENIKKRTKKKITDTNCYIFATGGGPPQKPIEITDIDLQINDILGSRVEGLRSEFGGDAPNSNTEIITIINDNCNENGTSEVSPSLPAGSSYLEGLEYSINEDKETEYREEKNSLNVNLLEEADYSGVDWSKAKCLKAPTSKVFPGRSSIKRKRNEYDALCNKVSHWAGTKASLENIKASQLEKEHALKLKLIQEKHDIEIELMRKEMEAKIERSNKEMEVFVEGMKEQNKIKKEILLLEKHMLLQKARNLQPIN